MKELTVEERLEVSDHIDKIFNLYGIPTINELIEGVKNQLPQAMDEKFWDEIKNSVSSTISGSFAMMGDEIISVMNNPEKAREMMEKIKK
jgi:hypothetical protein